MHKYVKMHFIYTTRSFEIYLIWCVAHVLCMCDRKRKRELCNSDLCTPEMW